MMQTYYLVLFLVSLALSGAYMLLLRKNFNVHITLIFFLIPIANLGFCCSRRLKARKPC